MPIPLIVWGIAAAGGAVVAWVNRKKIAEYFDSPEGREILSSLGSAMQGAMQPYRSMLDKSLAFPTSERRDFFREAKSRMPRSEWVALVGYGKGLVQVEPKYFAAVVDLRYVDENG